MRRVVLILLCLLSLATVWLFWPGRTPHAPLAKSSAMTVSSAAGAATGSNAVSAAASTASSATNSAATNRLAFRLTNTPKTLGQLTTTPHAILLENALVDTDVKPGLSIPKHLQADGEPGAFIVQARGVIDGAFRSAVMAAGGQIVSYIPNNAYLVQLSSAAAGRLAGNPLVQAVLPYEPYFKVRSSLLGRAVEQKPLVPGTVLTLGLFTATAEATEKQIEALGAKPIGKPDRSPFGPVVRVLPPADWTALARLPGVQVMEPSHQRVNANDLSRVTTGLAADTVTTTNYLDLSGSNVLVVVNDSGVDALHPDLTPRVIGFDLTDTNGHGTHVAGIIASSGLNDTAPVNVGANAQGSITNADFRGKAPLATIFSMSSANSDYALQTNAALQGALISNNSWAYGGDTEYDLAAASYDWATRDALPGTTGSQAVLFVFAAGNSGGGNNDGGGGSGDTILSPGTAKNVITVGALEQLRDITNIVTTVTSSGTTNQTAFWQPRTDSDKQVADYSSRGNVGVGTEGDFGRFKPDVVAPGTFVVSTRSSQWDTNAYFNPTNISTIVYRSQLVTTNLLNYYSVSVPPNAVAVSLVITPNRFSIPFPTNLFIYVQQSGFPDPVNAPGSIDITRQGSVFIPPDSGGAITGIQSVQNSGFAFAVGNTNGFSVNYDVTVSIATTNNVGDLYSVLQGMDDLIGPYYRYESGTSLSAAEVSGVLALIQDYFTNKLTLTPSPALLKALLINGARTTGSYSYAITNGLNFEGWGLVNIANSLPFTATNPFVNGVSAPIFFADQSPTNALATGDSHTYLLTLNTNSDAQFLPLQATLVWTDPCGDPAAAIKLVNNLDLIITNIDTGEVYYGNDISTDVGYNLPTDTNGPPHLDTINNVENIILPPMLAGNYSITVVGRLVNVNAVTAQTNNVVQDYALVIACGEGEVQDALTVGPISVASNPTGGQNLTYVTVTNSPLFNQFVGANTPLLGTNTQPLGANTIWGSNGQVTLGMTNQWHFYVVTNTGPNANFTNAAFITFNASTLSLPRMGVYSDTAANATRPEADIDMYVSTDPGLTNLSPAVIAKALAHTVTGTADSSGSSLTQGGTEFVFFTNSAPQQVYYVGIKSEDQMASEYAFLAVFTDQPFSLLDQNGNQIVNGIYLPVIPDGNNAHPGVTNVFALAIIPMQVGKVTVTNLNEHQNFGDLFGTLSFGGTSVVLNSHDGLGNTYGTLPLVYDDSRNPAIGTTNTDGPGKLTNFRAKSALGPWILTELDNAQTQTGQVSRLTLVIQPHKDLTDGGVIVTVPPGGWFIDFVDVPVGYTNLTFAATNLDVPPIQPPLQMFEKLGAEPTLTDFDQEADLTNCVTGTYPTGTLPGNTISVGPPLNAGQYFIGIYNPNTVQAASVLLSATLGIGANAADTFVYTTNSSTLLQDDAVTPTTLFVAATNPIASVNVGMVVNSPRISDLTFTLVSPTGQRVLLMENRGGLSTNGAGNLFLTTNSFAPVSANGGGLPQTNYLNMGQVSGQLQINWDMFTVPDRMTVYYGTNSALFGTNASTLLLDTGSFSGAGSTNITFGPGTSTYLTIIMNEFGNAAGANGTKWTYTAGGVETNFNYLVFTDDTNLATVPIKFAIPPYSYVNSGTNYTLSDFDLATNGNYFASTNIYDARGGWSLTNLVLVGTNLVAISNNLVSVVTDPATAAGGSNYLALANGSIFRQIPMTPGRQFSLSFQYRGPGISGWWRGEGNATDSSDPEVNGNNGELIGRFNFPAGEVGQSFAMEDAGSQFRFAGTNTYVQIHQPPFPISVVAGAESNGLVTVLSSALDVGTGGGFTVEGWINPTNVSFQQPLVEWLARTPTNLVGTNVVILAGPFLNPATSHYYYLLGATNWTESELWATEIGGHLATIDTANEQNWVFDNFANYGGTNRNLWIGLTNNLPATFAWSSGLTNVVYTNWFGGQPTNCDGQHNYTFMFGATNAQPGLWTLANTNGFICGSLATNKIYGVVEVDDLQPNGVQFWVSVTNAPGTTNQVALTNGCLFANLVDTTNGSHYIYSAPGLVQGNVFQHVALTYNTNSGLAMLYYNGTNVATTNFYIIPKTTGDVLLGKDMSRLTNNFFGGRMDEMSIYARSLSAAEISAIYRVSATATNGLTGKFDPSVTPALGLAEAGVSFGGRTNFLMGANNSWQTLNFSFKVTTNSLPFQITGLQPGMLLDSFNVSEQPLANLYYLPEQALSALTGSSAHGEWTLQIWDNRVGAAVSNQLVSWQLNFVLESNALFAASLEPQVPTPSTVGPGQTVYYQVNVPSWAKFATNILVSSTYPVDLLFNPTNVPSGSGPGDITLLTGQTSAAAVPPIAVNLTPPFAGRQAGSTYYLGVHNPGIHAAAVVLEVDYDIIALTNGVPFTSILTNTASDAVRYFSYDVSSNAFAATFQLLNLSSNADLVLRKGPPLPTLVSSDYGSFSTANTDETIYVLTNSTPVPLSAGHWYLGVFRRDSGPVNYTVLAKELDTPSPNIIELTNGVPVNFTAGPGAALTNFFHFAVTNMIVNGVTNLGLRFEVYNLSGNGNLTVQTNALPFAAPFFQTSQNPGQSPEIVVVYTNSVMTNLVADWYLGVPNQTSNLISFTIVASVQTNAYFPAFPGATGSGGGAVGGRFGTVYHVTSLGDSGPGTLRDAVSVANRTVIFDVSGTINLVTPLVITNSFLTIAGQTAPGGGITVAGQMTTVQSASHVVIRNVRFRSSTLGQGTATAWSNGFENLVGPQGGRVAGSYFCGGWHVDSGSIDVGALGSAPAYDGAFFVDLNGTSAGTISTNVPTVVGVSYTLSFAYSQNPDGWISGYPTASARVLQNGNALLTFTLNETNSASWANIQWATTSVVFTATAPFTQIQFASQISNPYGVLLDAVSLTTNITLNIGGADSLRFLNASNVIADHVSASWTASNLVSVLNSTAVTMQWSILGDSLFTTNNSSAGSLLRYGNGQLSFNHNLYADNYSGSPRLGDNLSLDFVNNVIYNWGLFSGLTGGTNDLLVSTNGCTNQLNYVCNYLIAGPDTARYATNFAITNIAYFGGTTNALTANWIFQTNNFIDSNTNRILDGANTQWAMFTNHYSRFEQSFPLIPVPTDEAFLAYEKVLAFAGVNMSLRDSVDTNIVAKVRNQTGTLISVPGALPVLNSTFPYLDTDQDGIPNFWEMTFSENPTNASNNLDRDGDGYTDLEEYNNWLAGLHALTVTNTPVGVDLMQLFGKTGNLSFFVTNGINGTVYLTNVLGEVTNTGPFSNSIAIFTPTNTVPPFSGYASFGVYATNNDTVAYFGPTPVSVVVSAVPILFANNTNTPPTFPTNATASVTNNELTLLTVTNTATAANTNLTLSYTVSMVIDTNAMTLLGWPLTFVTTTPSPVISPSGVITWTPSEAQGPGVYIISTVATDNGIPVLSATNSFTVTIYETNSAPFWATNVPSQTNYNIPALNLLVVTNTASDSDLPVNPLTYQLIGPTNATITTNGIISWTPTAVQLGLFTFTTIVTDTNIYALANQSLSATNTFTVFVTPVAGPFVFTQPAQAVTGAAAQLNGMVTPNGLPTTAWFEWGTTTNYGTATPSVSVGNGYNVVYTTNVISGLTTNVAYHFRVVAANAAGTNFGFDQILDEANVVAWGANFIGQKNVPAGLSNVVAIAGAYNHSLALDNNAKAVGWGDNFFGQATVQTGLSNLLAVAGGEYYSMVLKTNSTVAAWGANIFPGQTNVPAGLSNVVTIAGGTYASLALRKDGSIVAWGANFFGQTNVPSSASNAVAIAGGFFHNLAIKNDGTVIGWGDNSAGQISVPAGLSNVVAIAAGNSHSLALKFDGTVVAWGENGAGQTNVPAGLSNVVAIAAGGFHNLALKSDGRIVAWGDPTSGQTSVPAGLTNVVAIAAGNLHSLALTPQSIASLTNAIVLSLTNGVGQSNNVVAGGIIYYLVNVPTNADFATNILISADAPLNVWFTTNTPPTIGTTNDSLLFSGLTNGVSILNTTSAPPKIVPGAKYYLGVQNTNNTSVFFGIAVDFHLVTPPATNTVPISGIVYMNGGFLLTWFAPSNALFQVQFTTNLVPANWITFTNIISYNTNAFTNPTNTQFNFFDNGVQYPFGPSRFYRLILLGSGTVSNTPPVFNSTPTNRVINPLGSLVITNAATDADIPPQTLNYTLSTTATGTNLPTINTNTGVIVWTPDVSQAGSTNVFTTIVADNGTPSLSATNSFSVIVNPLPVISSITYSNGFLLKWLAPTNDIFEVQVATNLISPVWLTLATNVTYLGPVTPTNGWFSYLDNGTTVPFGPFRFYRLNLTGVTPPASPVVPPILISSIVSTNSGFRLTWFAPTNDQFNVRWATNLAVPVAWFPFANTNAITSTNGTFIFLDTNAPMLMKFYELILLP